MALDHCCQASQSYVQTSWVRLTWRRHRTAHLPGVRSENGSGPPRRAVPQRELSVAGSWIAGCERLLLPPSVSAFQDVCLDTSPSLRSRRSLPLFLTTYVKGRHLNINDSHSGRAGGLISMGFAFFRKSTRSWFRLSGSELSNLQNNTLTFSTSFVFICLQLHDASSSFRFCCCGAIFSSVVLVVEMEERGWKQSIFGALKRTSLSRHTCHTSSTTARIPTAHFCTRDHRSHCHLFLHVMSPN